LERELQFGFEKTVCFCVVVKESPKNGNRSSSASPSDTQFNTKKYHLKVKEGEGKQFSRWSFRTWQE
jgi:hypothetical protein